MELERKKYKIALAGNPNCGKTSIFNQLTGSRQHVGNYSGVTVESKTGTFNIGDIEIELMDLPGIYSLSSTSMEEAVAFRELITPGIDMIVNVVDSSIPQRSLYLTTQLAELHLPMVLAFNMTDEAEKKGISFKLPELEKYFGMRIVRTVGSNSSGVEELKNVIREQLGHLDDHDIPKLKYGADIDDAINELSAEIEMRNIVSIAHIPSRFFAIKLLEKDAAALKIPELAALLPEAEKQISHLDAKHAITADSFMADCRYALVSGACRNSVIISKEHRREISDKIDSVMANRFFGLPIFLLVIYLTFLFTFVCSAPLTTCIEAFFGGLGELITRLWPQGHWEIVRSLLVDGIIGGVGGVIVFLPNILFLFLAIAFLEDTGYMARAAFVMDGAMRKVGLHGKSFIPLVLGFGCTVPAIMAARCIESEKDRKTTILVLPLMSCGARLPIYAMIIPAFFPERYQAFTLWTIYVIGILFALLGARLMKSTLFKGESEIYLMELPPYRMPTMKSMGLHIWERCKMYLHKAGTIILFTSVILFLANTYPQKKVFSKDYEKMTADAYNAYSFDADSLRAAAESNGINPGNNVEELVANLTAQMKRHPVMSEYEIKNFKSARKTMDLVAKIRAEHKAEQMEYTISGRVGKALAVVFEPLGFDWKISSSLLSGLAAKEIFVSQLGILHAVGDVSTDSAPMRELLRHNYTPLQGFAIMLFCLLSIPCFATIAIVRKELNSWKIALCQAVGYFILAYSVTFLVYQICRILNIGTSFLY